MRGGHSMSHNSEGSNTTYDKIFSIELDNNETVNLDMLSREHIDPSELSCDGIGNWSRCSYTSCAGEHTTLSSLFIMIRIDLNNHSHLWIDVDEEYVEVRGLKKEFPTLSDEYEVIKNAKCFLKKNKLFIPKSPSQLMPPPSNKESSEDKESSADVVKINFKNNEQSQCHKFLSRHNTILQEHLSCKGIEKWKYCKSNIQYSEATESEASCALIQVSLQNNGFVLVSILDSGILISYNEKDLKGLTTVEELIADTQTFLYSNKLVGPKEATKTSPSAKNLPITSTATVYSEYSTYQPSEYSTNIYKKPLGKRKSVYITTNHNEKINFSPMYQYIDCIIEAEDILTCNSIANWESCCIYYADKSENVIYLLATLKDGDKMHIALNSSFNVANYSFADPSLHDIYNAQMVIADIKSLLRENTLISKSGPESLLDLHSIIDEEQEKQWTNSPSSTKTSKNTPVEGMINMTSQSDKNLDFAAICKMHSQCPENISFVSAGDRWTTCKFEKAATKNSITMRALSVNNKKMTFVIHHTPSEAYIEYYSYDTSYTQEQIECDIQDILFENKFLQYYPEKDVEYMAQQRQSFSTSPLLSQEDEPSSDTQISSPMPDMTLQYELVK